MFNLSIKENFNTPDKKIFINLEATDNNDINKIRIIFSQDSGWRAQTHYSMRNQTDFSIMVSDIKNIDSSVKVYLEIFDIYGNILTTNLFSIKIQFYEIIPYIVIGLVIGFSVGLASLSSILLKKYEEKKGNLRYRRYSKSEQEAMKVSFLDESEEYIDD
jgi:hypothetical protein